MERQSEPGQRRHDTLVSPSGASSDLVAGNSIQSGEIAAYLKMRDTVLPQVQNQLDAIANQMSQALSNQTTSGTAVSSGGQSGYSVDIGSLSPGNSFQVTYTDSANKPHTVTVVSLGQGGKVPAPQAGSNPNNQTIGIDMSGGMASIVSQLNSALGSSLQFSNPSGTTLQVLNGNGAANMVNALTATSTVTSLRSGSPQFQLFIDGYAADHRRSHHQRLADHGPGRPHLGQPGAGRLAGGLVSYAANTAAGDATRPNFIQSQMTTAAVSFPASTGIGTARRRTAAR